MAKVKKEKPLIIFRKEARGLVPATGFDAEELERLPIGTTVKVEPASDRGHDQLAYYWLILSKVVEATGRWPTREKLHDALKWEMGYVSVGFNMIGLPRLEVDSIALDSMSDEERALFIKQAFAKIAETTGIDPVALLKEAA